MKKAIIGKTGRSLLLAGVLCIAVVLAGCGKKTDTRETEEQMQETAQTEPDGTENGNEETAAEEQEEVSGEITVEVSEVQEEVLTDEEDRVLLTSKVNEVYVTIPGNQEAETAITQFFADLQSSYIDTITQYRDMAQEDLAFREEEDLMDGWAGYELGREYVVMRADAQMISIVENGYEYTGGAHPNAVQVAYNFDTKTGARMSLEDVASDLDEIRTESVRYLGEMLPESDYAESLFDDYADHLEDILTDSTWYTDEQGFHIICNEYIITPHSAGILDFVLPYGEVDVVAQEYIPASAEDTMAETEDEQGTDGQAGDDGTTDDRSASQHSSED